jgi:redox-sensitive bicupin YhaK (pirin superfamily)
MRTWAFNPHSGGVRIAPPVQVGVRARLERHAAGHYAGRYSRLDIRFRGTWLHIAEGALTLNGVELTTGDGASSDEPGTLTLIHTRQTEAILFDLS